MTGSIFEDMEGRAVRESQTQSSLAPTNQRGSLDRTGPRSVPRPDPLSTHGWASMLLDPPRHCIGLAQRRPPLRPLPFAAVLISPTLSAFCSRLDPLSVSFPPRQGLYGIISDVSSKYSCASPVMISASLTPLGLSPIRSPQSLARYPDFPAAAPMHLFSSAALGPSPGLPDSHLSTSSYRPIMLCLTGESRLICDDWAPTNGGTQSELVMTKAMTHVQVLVYRQWAVCLSLYQCCRNAMHVYEKKIVTCSCKRGLAVCTGCRVNIPYTT